MFIVSVKVTDVSNLSSSLIRRIYSTKSGVLSEPCLQTAASSFTCGSCNLQRFLDARHAVSHSDALLLFPPACK